MKKTLEFNFDTGDFTLNRGKFAILSDEAALRMWIQKMLKTTINCCKAYKGTGYGTNIEDLVIGKSYGVGFIDSELRREIEKALLQNEDITAISSFKIDRTGNRMTIIITLKTIYGDVAEEANIA